jgi:alkylation response protein AidB-like acyl-CoA dehydrogenase
MSVATAFAPEQILADVEDFAAKLAERAETMDRNAKFDKEVLDEGAALGFVKLIFDENLDLDLSRMPLVHDVTERIASVCPPVAMELGVMRLVAYLLSRYAPPAVKERWLQPTIDGHAYGSFALTEPQAGTDLRGMMTVARRDGDNYILTGQKCWVGFAPVASYAIVLCKLESTDRDAPTIALVVDMSSKGASGEAGPELSGFRGLSNGTLRFENVVVPAGNALQVDGFAGMMDGLNMARIDAASYACGLLRGALEVSVERAVTRTAFGKRIGDLPSIQIKLGRMRAAYHTARELTMRATETYMQGKGGDQDIISIAKMTASDLAREHTDQAMQIFGASGLIAYSRVERLHRDAKATQIFDGTSEIHETMLGRRLVNAFAKDGHGGSYMPSWKTGRAIETPTGA